MSQTLKLLSQSDSTFIRLRREHPEWWVYLVASLGWLVMAQHWVMPTLHQDHSMDGSALSLGSLRVELQAWLFMVCAMMMPTVIHPIRNLAFRSYRKRWNRARFCFLSGYCLPWVGLGLIYATIDALFHRASTLIADYLAALLFAVSALWVLTRARDRWLDACRIYLPLHADGWRADRDAHAQGMRVGWACVVTCGIPMVACAAAGHALLAMLAGAAIVWTEYTAFRPPKRGPVIGYGVLAILFTPWNALINPVF